MPPERARRELSRMLGAVCHEAFYSVGTWVEESLGVYLGWTAHRNSFSDGMPLVNERGDLTLVFAGEEYSEPDARRRLRARGDAVAMEGPSYLVHLCEEDGAFPGCLNGLFHGVLIDCRARSAMLFNDRYGMSRVYCHESRDGVYFAAEAKAILAARPELRVADQQSMGELVACGCVLENRTLFQKIQLLPPASRWHLRNGSVERREAYFRPQDWENQTRLEARPYYEALRSAFSRNLPRYFEGRERVATALTGGLDTRAIMAWRKPEPGTLPCYTFGSMVRETQDVRIARRVAAACGQPHTVIEVGAEFLAQFPRHAERSIYLTDGTVDVYRASDLYVSERAREIAPVKVVGTYGSEILRQAVTFKPCRPIAGLFGRDFLPWIDRAATTYAETRRAHPVTFAAFRQSPWHHYGILALEQTQLTVRSPYLDNTFVRTVFQAPTPDTGDVRLRLVEDGRPDLSRIRTDRGHGGGRGAAAAIARAALEFTFKAEYAYDSGMPQWLARVNRLLTPFHVEHLFIGRHKLSHFRMWYRDALSRYVREILLDGQTLQRPYLEPKGVEAVVQGHLKGDRNYTGEIHKLLTLELIQRVVFDSAGRYGHGGPDRTLSSEHGRSAAGLARQ